MDHTIKTRFAPSPTGYLHIGGLRTALYDFLFAKKNNGKAILRIEDTDKKRTVKGAVESLVETMSKVGLKFDEGVILKGKKVIEVGDAGPYFQSKRLKIYKKYLDQLIASGDAYYCFCSEERLAGMREDQAKRKEAPRYDGHCRNLSPDKIKQLLKTSKTKIIRLKIPENKFIEFNDLIYGQIKVNSNEIDDQVLCKSDGFPTYHLANVIDDHLMGITHVIRGEEWLPSTPKHIILYQAFKWELPFFAHLPLIVNLDRSKLSKRQGDVAVEDYLKKGYLPEALVNYIAFLGWNPKDEREFFTQNELIDEFDLKNINKASAVFDLNKLNWFNANYIRKLSVDDLIEKSRNFVDKKIDQDLLVRLITIEQSRLNNLGDLGERSKFILSRPKYSKDLLIFRKSNLEKTRIGLLKAEEILNSISPKKWQKEVLLDNLKDAVAKNNLTFGDLFWPVRAALCGEEKSPSPEELLWVLGKKESLTRINKAISML